MAEFTLIKPSNWILPENKTVAIERFPIDGPPLYIERNIYGKDVYTAELTPELHLRYLYQDTDPYNIKTMEGSVNDCKDNLILIESYTLMPEFLSEKLQAPVISHQQLNDKNYLILFPKNSKDEITRMDNLMEVLKLAADWIKINCEANDKIAVPKLGSIDKLDWIYIRELIKNFAKYVGPDVWVNIYPRSKSSYEELILDA